MDLLTYMQALFGGEGLNAWLRVAGLIGVTGLVDVVQRRVLSRLHAQLEKTEAYWDDAVVRALRRPLSLLVWVVGLSFMADVGLSQVDTALADMRDSLRVIGIVAAFSWFLARLISLVEEGIIALGQEGDEPTTGPRLMRLPSCCGSSCLWRPPWLRSRPWASASQASWPLAASAAWRSVLRPRICWPTSSAA